MLAAAHATAAKRFRLFSLDLHTVAALLASVIIGGNRNG
jgi:hypothetical protein